MPTSSPAAVPEPTGRPELHLSRPLVDRLVTTVSTVHAAGLKAFGLLVADPDAPRFPFTATDVVFFDPTRNCRNAEWARAAFEAQGSYFRAHEDAGFVADPAEQLAVHRWLESCGLEPVALFHVHRRQPANFSLIDFRLHNPAYPWHLIISLRDPGAPVVQPFAVCKDLDADVDISPLDWLEGSELPYLGPEVTAMRLVVDTADGAPVPAGAVA
ncbi:hypothetical protein LY71_104191 [Geodermatophilus tzadiensis]|uniref:Uncharacterized protein n=1 Tax=Geodermatophilus tzadiensis TaxID=1137988 RepID=A0A2T0TWT0_9ACTN|nr:Mov34/MPN/PAD-1 family protein [Geodermatophilus tzadiensis]PRY50154.1 hypothetical protein LY71_104191 [Geodermatophilus tzadiensis]